MIQSSNRVMQQWCDLRFRRLGRRNRANEISTSSSETLAWKKQRRIKRAYVNESTLSILKREKERVRYRRVRWM